MGIRKSSFDTYLHDDITLTTMSQHKSFINLFRHITIKKMFFNNEVVNLYLIIDNSLASVNRVYKFCC